MPFVCKYVALFVPDLREAEGFYRRVLPMDLLFRESEQEDGTWRTLRPDLDWEDIEARGIEVGMVALGRDAFVLAVFCGTPAPGTVFELCVGVAPDEVDAVRARLGEAGTVLETSPGLFRFQDPFGFRWAVQPADAPFRSSGEIAGRWIP
ncbi:MAG TPA: VOC family protein [Gaiellaceae bacterium]|nr:VOC family protein [Gaiellaceae bacterium]